MSLATMRFDCYRCAQQCFVAGIAPLHCPQVLPGTFSSHLQCTHVSKHAGQGVNRQSAFHFCSRSCCLVACTYSCAMSADASEGAAEPSSSAAVDDFDDIFGDTVTDGELHLACTSAGVACERVQKACDRKVCTAWRAPLLYHSKSLSRKIVLTSPRLCS
jgi:hypothetical protein